MREPCNAGVRNALLAHRRVLDSRTGDGRTDICLPTSLRALLTDRALLGRSHWTVAVAAGCMAASGCHVTHRATDSVEVGRSHRPKQYTARALSDAIRVTDTGRLRFVTAQVCEAEVVIESQEFVTTTKSANLATVVVGVIAASLGGAAIFAGLSADDGGGALAAGLIGLGAGAPLTIGPFLGRTTTRKPGGKGSYVKGEVPDEPCADAPISAESATVWIGPRRVFGSVDPDGVFSVPLYEIVDLYAVPVQHSLAMSAVLPTVAGPRRVQTTLDGETLARGRDGYVAGAGFDGAIEPLQKVPGLRHSQLSATISQADGIATVVVSFLVENTGPGVGYAVRGVIQADNPHLDGRVIYVGKLPKRESARPAVSIRIPMDAVEPDARIALYLKDGHDTAPGYTIRAKVSPQLKTMEAP